MCWMALGIKGTITTHWSVLPRNQAPHLDCGIYPVWLPITQVHLWHSWLRPHQNLWPEIKYVCTHYSSYTLLSFHSVIENQRWGLVKWLAVKRMCWSCRGPMFTSQRHMVTSQTSVIPVPWELTLYSGLLRHSIHVVHRHAWKTHIIFS